MITCLAYSKKKLETQVDFSLISDILPDRRNLVWVDVSDPTDSDMAVLKEEFEFHHLALEDAAKQQQRPKVDEYPGYFYLVIYALAYSEEDRQFTEREIDIFVGRNYMVTIHRDEIPAVQQSLQRWTQNPDMMGEGIGFLLYALVDRIIDEYFPVLDELDDRIEVLEQKIFEAFDPAALQEIFVLKRTLLKFRKILAPTRDIFNLLIRQDQPLFSHHTLLYFQDVYDHLIRILDAVDLCRDMLAGTLEAHLSVVSNRMSSVMKTLTIVATILMTAALITGFFGMNVEFPSQVPKYGFMGVIWSMALLTSGMIFFFWKIGWF
ncbi:MAG: magnesium/cobalt transporter CorA [Armatimonadetes bacterium]|nr:magnesium/cobalt transporter CorA [Armatimonadota bacterium]